jgi:hypothetical protein
MALIPGTLPNGTKYPNDPQTLLDTFASYLTAPEAKKNLTTVTAVTPAGGGTVTFNSSGANETLFLDLGGGITGLSVVFPTDANSRIGQRLSLFSTHAVAATVSYTNGTREPTPPTALAADVMYSWQKVKANYWVGSQDTIPGVTGWAAATGTATRTTFTTSTVTTAQLAERVKALIDDLITLGVLRS